MTTHHNTHPSLSRPSDNAQWLIERLILPIARFVIAKHMLCDLARSVESGRHPVPNSRFDHTVLECN